MQTQRTDNDCMICCISNVSGLPYEQVLHDLREWFTGGLKMEVVERYMGELGFCYLRRRRLLLDYSTAEWPPRPFAPLHIAMVTKTPEKGGHGIVLLNDGQVLDPAKEDRIQSLNDVWRVDSVTGFWPASLIVKRA